MVTNCEITTADHAKCYLYVLGGKMCILRNLAAEVHELKHVLQLHDIVYICRLHMFGATEVAINRWAAMKVLT